MFSEFKFDSNQEIIDGKDGLPSAANIKDQVDHIDAEFTIKSKDDFNGKTKDINFKRSKNSEIPENLYENFKNEYYEDIKDFELRIERLKIRLLSQYLAGTRINFKPKNLNEDLRKIRYAYQELNNEITKNESEEIIGWVNQIIPNEYRLLFKKNLIVADADEIKNLVEKIFFAKSFPQEERESIEKLLGEIKDIEKTLFTIQNQNELFSGEDNKYINEEKFKKLWDKYRTLLKKTASEEQLSSWHSPTYGTSKEGQRGKYQESIPFQTDYQRFKMPELETLEKKFGDSYFRIEKNNEYINHYLFNNGTSALNAALEIIGNEISEVKALKKNENIKIFKTKNIYFEVDNKIHNKFSNETIKEFDGNDTIGLIDAIKKELPEAVFISPLSNSYDMTITEVTKILEELGNDRKWKRDLDDKMPLNEFRDRKMYLVIDNSTLGRLAKWKNFNFSKLPDYIKILSFESLIKYAQDGQELTQAGIITAIGNGVGSAIEAERKKTGSAPPEDTVRKLSSIIPQDLIDKKMKRHSRNAEYIVQTIKTAVAKQKNSFVEEIIYPQSKETEMENAGGIFNIGFNQNALRTQRVIEGELSYQKKLAAKAFSKLIIKLATTEGIEINSGTSYGFNTTRIAVYEKPDGAYYMRIAPGTENIKDSFLIATIIKRANEIFSEAIEDKTILDLIDSL